MLYSCTHMATVGVKGLTSHTLMLMMMLTMMYLFQMTAVSSVKTCFTVALLLSSLIVNSFICFKGKHTCTVLDGRQQFTITSDWHWSYTIAQGFHDLWLIQLSFWDWVA